MRRWPPICTGRASCSLRQQARNRSANLDLLWPLLDVTTTLDPNLIAAYHFGGMFLSDSPPRGAGQPQQGIKLLERGIRANPEHWRFFQDLDLSITLTCEIIQRRQRLFWKEARSPAR